MKRSWLGEYSVSVSDYINSIMIGDYIDITKEKTMEDLEVGDVVYKEVYYHGERMHKYNEYKVQARLGDLVFLSEPDEPNVSNNYWHWAEMKDNLFLLDKPDNTKEMTVAEISKELGYDVKIVKEN